MNLVDELQISAEKDEALAVLRKAKRLAFKLNRQDIADWLKAEQEGYDSDQDVPSYRVINAVIAYNTNGYIPAGYGYLKSGIVDLPSMGNFPTPLVEPISDILSMIESVRGGKCPGVYITVNDAVDESIRANIQINPRYARQISFLMHLNHAQIMAIPEQIKDKVLDWACALEAAGVTGDGLSFSPKEKEIAHAIMFNIHNSNIEQLNNLGTNQKGSS